MPSSHCGGHQVQPVKNVAIVEHSGVRNAVQGSPGGWGQMTLQRLLKLGNVGVIQSIYVKLGVLGRHLRNEVPVI